MKLTKTFCTVLAVVGLIGFSNLSYAAGEAEELPDMSWEFEGPFGHYDKAALQRGLQVYRNVCSACHSLKRVRFRNLEALGYDESQIKAIAAEYTVTDGPNDEGEIFDRPARPSDAFPSPYANDKQAAYANNGAIPPDLSVSTQARAGGATYTAALLHGYEDPPAEWAEKNQLLPGQYYNKYMAGHVIAMPPPLAEGQVAYEDGTETTVEQYSRDVAHFLNWAAEPELEERKRMGVKVFLFLLAFAGIMFAVKKRVWSDIKGK